MPSRARCLGIPTVYTVNLTSDTGAFSGTDAATATSGDLLWAVTQANANTNPAGSVIEFSPTVFNASSPKTIALPNTLELSESPWPIIIQGPGANALTISGANAVGVFQVDGDTTAVLSCLTMSNSDSSDPGIEKGGSLTVTDCVISNNRGGGILNPGWLTIMGSTIADNSNSAGSFGGSWNQGVATVTDSTIAVNLAGGFDNAYLATVVGSTIIGNSAEYGGGVANQYGTLDLIDTTIDDNSATGTGLSNWGGGVDFSTGSMRVTDCTIVDNSAVGAGGGIFVYAGALTIANSTIADNSVGAGPSRYTGPSGGGLFVVNGYQPPGTGFEFAPVILDNSILVTNTDANGADDIARYSGNVGYNVALSPESANNLIGVDETGTLTAANHNLLNVTDPGLGTLANNGGPTQTIALLPDSPAIGAGSVALAVDANGNPLTTDQRGDPRIIDGKVDIGALEGQEESTATTVTASPATSVSGQSVTFTATVAPQSGSAITTATGSIQFEVDGTNFGSPVAMINGSAASTPPSARCRLQVTRSRQSTRATRPTLWPARAARPSRSRRQTRPTSSPSSTMPHNPPAVQSRSRRLQTRLFRRLCKPSTPRLPVAP